MCFLSKSVGTQYFKLLHLFTGFCVILVDMQARITKRKNRDGSVREYLQIVRSVRKPDKKNPSHEVIANLGRMDLIKEGHIDTLVQNLAKFTIRSKVVDLEQDLFFQEGVNLGPRMILEHIWKKLGLPFILDGLGIPMNRAETIFQMVLMRVEMPLSKRGCQAQIDHYLFPADDKSSIYGFYRAMDDLQFDNGFPLNG